MIKKFLALFIMFGTLHTAQAEKNDPTDAIVQKMMPAWMAQNKISGAAISIYTQGIPHTYYFGYANNQSEKKIDAHTIFEVGSITKLFTALLFAEEINQGHMKLDDPMVKYLPDLISTTNPAVKKITLGNLATHTASLPKNFPDDRTARSDLPQFFIEWKPVAPIGSVWGYANSDYSLLGYSLEAETHMSFNQLYRNRILQPLGMSAIGLTVPKKFQADYAQGYDASGKPAERISSKKFVAAGDLKLSAQDGFIFLRSALNLGTAPDAIKQAMQLSETPFVTTADKWQGLGFDIQPHAMENKKRLLMPDVTTTTEDFVPAKQLPAIQQKFNADALIEKTGETGGFSAYLGLIPNQKSGIVILTNRADVSKKARALGRTILLNLGSE